MPKYLCDTGFIIHTPCFQSSMSLEGSTFFSNYICIRSFYHASTSHHTLLDRHAQTAPDSKVHGAEMGPTWGQQDPGWPHDGSMNFAIWEPSPNEPPQSQSTLNHINLIVCVPTCCTMAPHIYKLCSGLCTLFEFYRGLLCFAVLDFTRILRWHIDFDFSIVLEVKMTKAREHINWMHKNSK